MRRRRRHPRCELRARDVTGASTTMFSRDTCLDNKLILLTCLKFGRALHNTTHYSVQVFAHHIL